MFLYVLGPGIGESQVVVFPDGKTLVVDSCHEGNTNLPEALLKHLGQTQIELLVLTHPDFDHVRGFATLVRKFSPRAIWRYPQGNYIRDFVCQILERKPNDARFKDLRDSLAAIDDFGEQDGEPTEARIDRTHPGQGYEIRCIAPTPIDINRAQRLLDHGAEYVLGHRTRVSKRIERFLNGDSPLGDVPNVLSVALAISWGKVRVVLGGDVENGLARKPFSGWKGVLQMLDKSFRAHLSLVDAAVVVKVPHHGSRTAFHAPAWQRHAKPDGSTVAVIAPFRGKKPLPEKEVLQGIATHCSKIGVSAGITDVEKTAPGAWNPDNSLVLRETAAPCLVVAIDTDGTAEVYGSMGSAMYIRP